MIPTLITLEIGFMIIVTLITVGYAIHNLKLMNYSLRMMDVPVFVHCRNQILYRRNLLCSCYVVIIFYYISQIVITSAWCIWLFFDTDEVRKTSNKQSL